MKIKHLALWFVCLPILLLSFASCGNESSSPKDSNTDGGSGSAGNPADVWRNGEIGTVKKVSTIMNKGGYILGLDIKRNAKPLMKTMDGELDGGLPPTIPTIDFTESELNSTLVVIVPPYKEPAYAPYTVYFHPSKTVDVVSHYTDWTNELDVACFGDYPVVVNSISMQTYAGMMWDVASDSTRDFITTTADDCIYQVMPDGSRDEIVCGLEGPSSLIMHPDGFLVVTTLPTYPADQAGALPLHGVRLYKVEIDTKTLTEIAEMPIPNDYETDQSFCGQFTYTQNWLPTTMWNPVALWGDGSFMLSDVGAGKVYKVSEDGSMIEEYATTNIAVAGLTVAHDVLYAVNSPVLGDKWDGEGPKIAKDATMSAWDEALGQWVDVTTLPGYINYPGDLSAQQTVVTCPQDMVDLGYMECFVPLAITMKLVPGQTATDPYIIVSDRATARIFQITLTYGTESDAGAAGASGTSGSAGSAGAAGGG